MILENKSGEYRMSSDLTPSLQTRHDETLVELKNYKLLVENVEDYAIFLLDTGGHIISWNKGAERNKGYKRSEIIGKHFSIFYTQEDKDAKKPERELEIAQKVGRVEDEDWRVRKDGSRFWANVVITALFDSSNTLVGYAKVTRDLSERKQHEDELRRANTLLRKQQQELTLASASKDEFISLASHQLRTPATAIKQLLGLLLEGFYGDISADQLQIIRKAYQSNDRQIAIVNSLLKVAQLDAGKVILRKERTDIGQLVRDVIDEQSDTINGRHQIIEFTDPGKPIFIEADKKYLRMALENIIDNASKYTPESGSISISASLDDKNMTVRVADTGVGITQDQMSQLFQKFKRFPNELSQKVEGTGLGLYWVREVIRLHGGNVGVESEAGNGTTFTINLARDGHA